MSRFLKCLNYQIKTKIIGSLIFLGFYAAIYAALLTLFSVTGGSVNASLFFAATIFVFVYVIADYRSKTNYMMMLGNSRKNIFVSLIHQGSFGAIGLHWIPCAGVGHSLSCCQ
jgi:hypothetical protein